jgi:hypothetical protein
MLAWVATVEWATRVLGAGKDCGVLHHSSVTTVGSMAPIPFYCTNDNALRALLAK